MNQTSECIGGVPGTIFELRNGIVGKPAPMAALFSFPAPCASGWKDLARTRECANKNRHPFSAPVEWLNKRQGERQGPERRAGPSSFHLLAVPRIQFGRIRVLRSADAASLPDLIFSWTEFNLTNSSIKSYPSMRGPASEIAIARPRARYGPLPLLRRLILSWCASRLLVFVSALIQPIGSPRTSRCHDT
jgi:hypothetical protein